MFKKSYGFSILTPGEGLLCEPQIELRSRYSSLVVQGVEGVHLRDQVLVPGGHLDAIQEPVEDRGRAAGAGLTAQVQMRPEVVN